MEANKGHKQFLDKKYSFGTVCLIDRFAYQFGHQIHHGYHGVAS